MTMISRRFGPLLALGLLMLGLGWLAPAPALAAEPLPQRISNQLGMEFVLIPAGKFVMGTPVDSIGHKKDEVIHHVFITKPFYMQTTEVTLKQWRAVMGRKFFGKRKGEPNSPVTNVSWYEVQEFLEKLNDRGKGKYRLPTEAQWEYAVRAGTTTAFSWQGGIDCPRAMFSNAPDKRFACVGSYELRGLEPGKPAPVGSFKPNPWGLYDMNGNVWEWCSDWYAPYPTAPVHDPKGPGSGTYRVRRGGSWYSSAASLRNGNRNFGHPAIRENTIGFRLVREAQ